MVKGIMMEKKKLIKKKRRRNDMFITFCYDKVRSNKELYLFSLGKAFLVEIFSILNYLFTIMNVEKILYNELIIF